MQRYFIKTYGCQMNKGDSDRLSGILASMGYSEADSPEKSDILLVNTCVVRKNAEDKAAWYIQSLKGAKKKNPNLVIGVCGCLVTSPTIDIKKDFPHVDIFIPPGRPEMLAEFLNISPSISKRGGNPKGGGELTAWIPIMEGCDNFCSYCIVPYTRGRERSRPVEEVLDEIKRLDFDQVKEIYLLGQNVNSYKYGLAKLLREIDSTLSIEDGEGGPRAMRGVGEVRIRFMTSHPKDMSDEIINAVAALPRVCEYFHLPIQHGDDYILKKMNRPYTIDEYRKIVDKIRSKMPDAAITSDIIVGFSGETEDQFQNSINIIREIGFDAVNTAAYSVRLGTSAAKLPDDIPESVKQERLRRIMEVVDEVVLARNEKLVGTTQELLVESKEDNFYKGRTRTNKIVKFSSPEKNLIGKLVDVRIKSVKSWILEACLSADREKLSNDELYR